MPIVSKASKGCFWMRDLASCVVLGEKGLKRTGEHLEQHKQIQENWRETR